MGFVLFIFTWHNLYRFALNRLQNRQDAEDLTQEILLHVIKGISIYNITNLDAWVWKVAYNRYNVFLRQKYAPSSPVDDFSRFDDEAPDILDTIVDDELRNDIFVFLHSLSSNYRDILVQYYVHEKQSNRLLKCTPFLSPGAICLAAYETPLTIEEISMATGIPSLYIEDEMEELEYGDAIINQNGKYATVPLNTHRAQ